MEIYEKKVKNPTNAEEMELSIEQKKVKDVEKLIA